IDGGVELWEDFQGSGADFQGDSGDRHFAAGLFGFGSEARAQLFEFSNVGAIMLRDMRNRIPGFGQMLGRLAANAAHRDMFNLSPFGKIGKFGRDKMPGAGGRRWSRAG